MHTLLIPYDFSLSANNAAEFALSLFKNRATRFIFVHVTEPGTENTSIIVDQLNSDIDSLAKVHSLPHHSTEHKVIEGKVVESLSSQAQHYCVDAIFMGTKGKTDTQSNLMGSITAGLIEESRVPIMVIPKRARYSGFRKMVLGTDYRPVRKFESYDYLMKLLQLSNAEFIVLNVQNENEALTMEHTMAGIEMARAFADRPHRYEFVHHESRVQGLLHYVSSNDIDLLAMLKRDHYLLDDSRQESVVGRAAMEMSIDIPLLSLPLKKQ